MKFSLLIYIGRFQFLHNGQIAVMKAALEQAEHLLILIGSSNRSRDIRNPFSYAERRSMIQETLDELGLSDRVSIGHLPDTVYGNGWFNQVVSEATMIKRPSDKPVGLIGHDKDATSYYLKKFPQLEFVPQPLYEGLHSTDMRRKYFTCGALSGTDTSIPVINWVDKWYSSDEYSRLQAEFKFVENYQITWPERIYNTADAVVTYDKKILVIRRGGHPGKGLLALPGGFVNTNERLINSSLRELEEETNVTLTSECCVNSFLCDDVNRDVRRRIISNAFHFAPDYLDVSLIQAKDDANEAFMMDIREFLNQPTQIFSDHWFVVKALGINY